MRPAYDGFACWEAYGGDAISPRVKDWAGFLMACFLQALCACLFALGYQIGKQPDPMFLGVGHEGAVVPTRWVMVLKTELK